MKVVSVNVSEEKGTIKHPVPKIVINDKGVRGDAHSGHWHRQVSLLGQESIDRFVSETGRRTSPGEFAENITTQGMDLGRVGILDKFSSGDLLLEVTQIGKEYHGDVCAIFREVGKCVMPKEGIFTRVLKEGTLKPGDDLVYDQRLLQIRIITLSDRASRGEYEDKSGPAVENALNEFFQDKRWHPKIERTVLRDDAKLLKEQLESSQAEGCDIVITTGGTGVGPRDFTPEVVIGFCDKIIPGIMEHIRMKFGSENPNALLSRSVAGVKEQTLVYALPGSVRAVQEYMAEILKTMEHLILTIHGLDIH